MPRIKKTEEKVEKKAKATTVKKAADAVAADVKKTIESAKVVREKASKLVGEIFDLEGKAIEKISLPEEVFGVKLNKSLIAQAVRVIRANQRQGNASTKTRGEVEGSTRKIYRQKGTGRARHGSVRAPIFVHGGIVGGPKPRDYSLQLPKKMKRAALISAISEKFKSGEIKFVSGFEKIEPKTKKFVGSLSKLGFEEKKRKLLVISANEIENLKRAAGNVEGVTMTVVKRLNTYDVLNNRNLLIMKDAVEELKSHLLKKKSAEVKKV